MPATRTQRILDKITVFKRTELFGSLSDDLLRKITSLTAVRQLTRGQVLYSEHEEALSLYVVAQGEIRSVRETPDGREQVLSTEHPGATLGVVPVFNGGKFYSTTIADTDSEVFSIHKDDVHRLCKEHTEILWQVARTMAHKVRHYAELVEVLALRNVDQRLAQYILTIARERGVRIGEDCIVELTLTRTEIANRVGSAREVISRALTHLQRLGLIQIQGRRLVTIPDMRMLSAFAGAERRFEISELPSEISSEIA